MSDTARLVIGWLWPLALVAPIALRKFDIGRMLSNAAAAAGMPLKEVAYEMGLSESHLSKQIRGIGKDHLSADRLTRLPRTVWLHLYLAIGEHLGVSCATDARAEQYARRAARTAQAALKAGEGARYEQVA
jgi:hypothetical protein